MHLIGYAGYKMFANQTVVFGHPKNCNAKRTWAKFASPKGDFLPSKGNILHVKADISTHKKEHFGRQKEHVCTQ